ncbi:MAG: SelT/SelW/SelH family protein [Gemmatimonadota bacterium]
MPRASGLEAAIRKRFPTAQIELLASSGGAFEVVADGRLIHSKKATGTFPPDEAVLRALGG